MLSEELHSVALILCPYGNWSIPVHACKGRLWFEWNLLYATFKTAVSGGFFVKISVNKDNLRNSDRKQEVQREAKCGWNDYITIESCEDLAQLNYVVEG